MAKEFEVLETTNKEEKVMVEKTGILTKTKEFGKKHGKKIAAVAAVGAVGLLIRALCKKTDDDDYVYDDDVVDYDDEIAEDTTE